MANINDYNFAGKKAIVRVDFNVPLNEKGEITDDTRIRGALPTLKKILADGGSLILMSHMGKPKGKVKPELSLGQIVDAVSAALGVKVAFAPDCAKASEAAAALKPGEALLLENLRFYPEEEGKPVGIDKAKAKGVNLVLAEDCVCADSFSNDANTQVCSAKEIPAGWEGLDIGPKSRVKFADAIKNAKTILWNGPAGVFEFDNFAVGSKAIADAIVEATKNGAFSLVGGGDSVACVNKFGYADQVSYVSTGGGALLEAIEGKVLPGVAAIKGE